MILNFACSNFRSFYFRIHENLHHSKISRYTVVGMGFSGAATVLGKRSAVQMQLKTNVLIPSLFTVTLIFFNLHVELFLGTNCARYQ